MMKLVMVHLRSLGRRSKWLVVALVVSAVAIGHTPLTASANRAIVDWFTTTEIGEGDSQAIAVAEQSDGRLVVGGYGQSSLSSRDFAIARYDSDGSLDTTFGDEGLVMLDLDSDFRSMTDLVVDSEDRIIAVGVRIEGFSDFDIAVFRFEPDGDLDPSFGISGYEIIDLGGNDVAQGVGVQSNGDIVIAGETTEGADPTEAFVLRLDGTDGELDLDFGTGGVAIDDLDSEDVSIREMSVDATDRLVVAGFTLVGGVEYNFLAARFSVDGELDSDFGVGGVTTIDFGDMDATAIAVAIQPDSKILLSGTAGDMIGRPAQIARLLDDGSLDPGFGEDGITTSSFDGVDTVVHGMTLQNDGRIILFGALQFPDSNYDFLVARYLANGELDDSFDDDGYFVHEVGPLEDLLSAGVALSNGRIVAVAYSNDGSGYSFAMAQFGSRPRSTSSRRSITLDPNGGSCLASETKTAPWTIRFHRSTVIPGLTECTRDGFVFGGWADAANPDIPRNLTPFDDAGTERYRVGRTSSLVAIWHTKPAVPSYFVAAGQIFCSSCNDIWLAWTTPSDDSSVTITDESGLPICGSRIPIGLDWNFCVLSSPDRRDRTFVLTTSNQYAASAPLTTTVSFGS